jgi:hypothetical protein
VQSIALALAVVLSQAPEAQPMKTADAAAVEKTAPAEQAADTAKPVSMEPPWYQRVTLNGFARVGVFYNLPLREDQLVGGNGGFRLADFRLGAEFHPVDAFSVTASIELAAPVGNDADPLTGRRVVEVRDAYATYHASDAFNVSVGQLRPGYYAEMLMSDAAIPFVSRSILANGLTPPDGYVRAPLAPDRQLGLQVFSKRLGDDLGFRYMVGVFNGNGMNQLFNDNNIVEPVARVEVDFQKHVTVGLNALYNVRTEGVRPNRLSSNQLGYGADVAASFGGFSALVGFLGKSTSFSYAGLQPENAYGAMGQVRYFHEETGLEVAARVAWYEPSSAQVQDQLTEIAGMVGWKPFKLPFRILAQYTHREEEQGVAFPNDSVDVMLHAVW